MNHTVASLFAAGLLAVSAGAGASPTLTSLGGDQYQVSFDPLSFTITTAGEVASIVFEDFFAAVQPSCGGFQSGTVEASRNGGALQALGGNSCTGAYDALNDVDGNDLLVTFLAGFSSVYGTVNLGDTLAVSSANYVFSLGGLNPAANAGPYGAFLVNNSFERVSNIVQTNGGTVPEPGTLVLLGLALGQLGYSLRKQRQRA